MVGGEKIVMEFAGAVQGSLLGMPTGPKIVQCPVDVTKASAWAYFSEDRRYRYLLGRRWASGGNVCLFVLLNPSTADALTDDPTVRRCVGFATMWGHTEMRIVNLFGFRTSDPKELPAGPDAIGLANDAIARTEMEGARRIVCGWGAGGGEPELWRIRQRAAQLLLRQEIVTGEIKRASGLLCFGHTKAGHPKHPLYLGKNTPLEPLRLGAFG